MQPSDPARDLARSLVELKAEEVVILDLTGISDLFDAFVLATGTSETHRRALAETAWAQYRRRSNTGTGHREGVGSSGWMLLDCGDVIVHIMSPELRDYYELEEFWGDAPRTVLTEEDLEETG